MSLFLLSYRRCSKWPPFHGHTTQICVKKKSQTFKDSGCIINCICKLLNSTPQFLPSTYCAGLVLKHHQRRNHDNSSQISAQPTKLSFTAASRKISDQSSTQVTSVMWGALSLQTKFEDAYRRKHTFQKSISVCSKNVKVIEVTNS
jgi:hypothetical protein